MEIRSWFEVHIVSNASILQLTSISSSQFRPIDIIRGGRNNGPIHLVLLEVQQWCGEISLMSRTWDWCFSISTVLSKSYAQASSWLLLQSNLDTRVWISSKIRWIAPIICLQQIQKYLSKWTHTSLFSILYAKQIPLCDAYLIWNKMSGLVQ